MKHVLQRGVTLLELMVALIIISILFGVGIPTFREFTRNNRVTAGQNDLVTALNLARSEALRRSRAVTVCASTDQLGCATANDWASGWIVFIDGPGGTPGSVDAAETILQGWDSLGGDVVLTADQAFVRYMPTGESDGPLNVDLTPKGCTAGQHKDRRISISGSGSLNSQLTDC